MHQEKPSSPEFNINEFKDDLAKAVADVTTFKHSAKFVLSDLGSVHIDGSKGDHINVTLSDAEADCTLITDSKTFMAINEGKLDPTEAWEKQTLKLEGDPEVAQEIGDILVNLENNAD